MSFFKKLFSSPKSDQQVNEAPKSEEPDLAILPGNGEFDLQVVGESHYQEALETICGPRTRQGVQQEHTALLILEDHNPYDKKAVRVEIDGKQVGYLSREVAKLYRQQLKAGGMPKANGQCQALIKGGWERGDNKGSYGVWLDIPVQ